jgi:hypothetical protein
MRRPVSLFIVLAALIGGCTSNPDPESSGGSVQPLSSNLTEVPGMARYALAEPIQINNVSIVPVISKENQDVGPEYATLAEAKKNAWIDIIEEPGDAEVNQLRVRNVGPKPILLLSGELLLGGKQDRVVAKDTIVPPGKEVEVSVYCVEPGRWTGSTHKVSYGDTTVPLKVRNQAVFGNQSSVWREVGGYNEAAKASGGRSTIQAGLEKEEVQKQITTNLESVRGKLAGMKNVVGVMFLVDGEVQTLELFGNARLFNSSRDSLLKGALAQAAVGGSSPAMKVDLASCAKFMSDAMQSNRVVESRQNGAVSARRASPAAKGVEMHFDEDKGESGLLHGSYAKQ